MDVFFKGQSVLLLRTNYAHLIFLSACFLFLYSYETDFTQGLLMKNGKPARFVNFTLRYKDDVLSPDNYKFGDYVDRVCAIELEIKDTTDTARFAS